MRKGHDNAEDFFCGDADEEQPRHQIGARCQCCQPKRGGRRRGLGLGNLGALSRMDEDEGDGDQIPLGELEKPDEEMPDASPPDANPTDSAPKTEGQVNPITTDSAPKVTTSEVSGASLLLQVAKSSSTAPPQAVYQPIQGASSSSSAQPPGSHDATPETVSPGGEKRLKTESPVKPTVESPTTRLPDAGGTS